MVVVVVEIHEMAVTKPLLSACIATCDKFGRRTAPAFFAFVREVTSSVSTAGMAMIDELNTLRKLVGNEPREIDLVHLLERHRGDVNAAANEFFDGGAPRPGQPVAQRMPVAQQLPIAQPVPQQQLPVAQPAPSNDLISVSCPAGVSVGDEIQVSTPAGLMLRVKIPAGVSPGTSFLVRTPPSSPAVAVAQPLGGGAPSSGYPGQAQTMAQPPPMPPPPPQTIIVHSSPYYGGYGYGYDPFLGVGMGMLGGVLIADALWW